MPDEEVVVNETVVEVQPLNVSEKVAEVGTTASDRMIEKLRALEQKAAAVEAPKADAVVEKPVVEEKKEDEVVAEDDDDLKLPIDDIKGEEKKEDEVVDPDAPADPKAARAFKNLRLELKTAEAAKLEAETKFGTLESRIKELEAKEAAWTEKEQKLAEYERDFKVVRLESSPEYLKEVGKPLQDIVLRADEIADSNGIDKNELTRALDEPDKDKRKAALRDLLAGIDDDDRLEVRELARKLDSVREKETELRTNADKVLSEIAESKTKAEQEAILARAEERKTVANAVANKFVKKLPAALHEAVRGDILKYVEVTDIDALDTATKVYNAQAGQVVPLLLKERAQLTADLQEALDELEAIRKAQPTVDPKEPSGQSVSGNGGFLSRVTGRLGISA